MVSATDLRVCVAIPTYGREKYLLDTLQQLLDQERAADEIIVIDQTPEVRPITAKILRELQEKGAIRYFKCAIPNTPGARNLALRETRCDIIVFIDDDVVLPSDFVLRHLRNYKNQEIDAVAGRVIQANWKPPNAPAANWPRVLDTLFFDRSVDKRVEGISTFAGNHSARVGALRSIGGYDENYLGNFMREESDAALRLWKAAYRIDFDPEAYFRHLAAPGGSRMMNKKSEWMLSFSELYFAVRHLFPGRWFWKQVCLLLFRKYVLRRENVVKPWRLPWATGSYGYAVVMAFRKAKEPKLGPEPSTVESLALVQSDSQ